MKQQKTLRRLLCAVLCLVMILAIIPAASAAKVKPVNVDMDMQVKLHTWNGWSNGPVWLQLGTEFDYRTILYSEKIKTAFRSYYDTQEARIKELPEPYRSDLLNKLENTEIDGRFTVKIFIDPEIKPDVYDRRIVQNNHDMYGFNPEAMRVFKETNRTYDATNNIITIEIATHAPGNPNAVLKAGEVKANIANNLPDMTFTAEGLVPQTIGAKTVQGTLSGSATFYDAFNKEDVTVNFSGKQIEDGRQDPRDTSPAEHKKIQATVDINGNDVVRNDPNPIPTPVPRPYPTQIIIANALNTDDHFCYIIGYPDGNVRPTRNITREEITTVFYRLLRVENRVNIAMTTNSFKDVSKDRWSNKAISTMSNGGYVKGYPDGTFRPANPITRAEFVEMAVRFANLSAGGTNVFNDIGGHWAYDSILKAYNAGWITGYGDGSFKPNAYITRAEVMTIINRMLGRRVDATGLLPEAHYWPDMNGTEWYYYDVMEATNAHDYYFRKDGNEKWTAIDVNFVWVEKGTMENA